MKRLYESKNDFWVGEINKEIKRGMKVEYDDVLGILILGGQTYTVKNLKAVIKAEWLVPVNGDYPELDGPVGETQEQALDRKRKARFEEQAKSNSPKIKRDELEIAKIKGCIDESRDPEGFAQSLGVDPLPNIKAKYTPEVVKDDTKVIKDGTLFDDTETKQIKKAMNQEPKIKVSMQKMEIFNDHYDADTKNVGKYTSDNIEDTLKNWSGMHWTKKEDIINKAGKDLLKELKNLSNSDKIINRINKRLETLQ